MDLQRLPPPPEDDEQKEFLLDDEDFYNTVNFGPEWQEQPDIQFPHDEQMAAAYKDMVAPVKAQGASRRVIEFEESAGIGLQEDIEEIENAVAEHQLADIHESHWCRVRDRGNDREEEGTTCTRVSCPRYRRQRRSG